MKKFLASTITAAAIFSAAIIPTSAAAPVDCGSINIETIRPVICRWLEWNGGSFCPTLPDISLPTPDDGTTEQPDTQLPETNQPETEQPDSSIPETDKPESSIPETEQPEQDENQNGNQTQAGSASAIERQVVELVNEQRAAYGLAALELNTELCDGARLKSQDMATQGYFSHESPTYGSPFDMMRSLGISYRTAGENIAMGYSTAEAVVNAWMNSEGHRANILSANYTQIGVGYVASGNYWTQWFIS